MEDKIDKEKSKLDRHADIMVKDLWESVVQEHEKRGMNEIKPKSPEFRQILRIKLEECKKNEEEKQKEKEEREGEGRERLGEIEGEVGKD